MDDTHGAAQPDANGAEPSGEDGEITIYIDRNAFRIPRGAVTGGTLRALATPAIGGEYELYHVSPGSEPDRLVHDEEVVELEDGSQFFSAPRMITAGRTSTHRRRLTRLLLTLRPRRHLVGLLGTNDETGAVLARACNK
jgi:hypothetical protein